jgi:hypothetical protein
MWPFLETLECLAEFVLDGGTLVEPLILSHFKRDCLSLDGVLARHFVLRVLNRALHWVAFDDQFVLFGLGHDVFKDASNIRLE